MRTIQLTIAFDGSRYEGWQSQRKGRTLQEVFEKALSKLFAQPVAITGSSRTDSGVHARGFVAHFRIESGLSDAKILKAINFYLPRDIVVLKAKTVPANFHARFRAKSKHYRYTIWNSPVRPVFERPYSFFYPHKLNISLMKQAARYLKGKHDFKAFQDKGDELVSTVRTIKRISIKKEGSSIHIDIEGDGFLRHMIRILVGTLIEVSKKRYPPVYMKELLHSKDRMKAGPTIKAHGLSLLSVKY